MSAGGVRRVYFITGAGKTKVGVAENVGGRLRYLQCGSPVPLTLVFSTPGDVALERALHRHMGPDHSHGEWFWGAVNEVEAKRLVAEARQSITTKKRLPGRRTSPLRNLTATGAEAYLRAQAEHGIEVRADIRKALEEKVAFG